MAKIGSKLVHEDGTDYYVSSHDVSGTIELCNAMRQENREFDAPDGSGRLVASVPVSVLNEAIEQGVNIYDGSDESSKWLFNKLNGDWKAFKITSGNLAVTRGHI